MRERILSIIEKNSRIDLHELAVIMGEPEIEVANELKRMEEEGIICGYHTDRLGEDQYRKGIRSDRGTCDTTERTGL